MKISKKKVILNFNSVTLNNFYLTKSLMLNFRDSIV